LLHGADEKSDRYDRPKDDQEREAERQIVVEEIVGAVAWESVCSVAEPE
jgi:hypothetical protein